MFCQLQISCLAAGTQFVSALSSRSHEIHTAQMEKDMHSVKVKYEKVLCFVNSCLKLHSHIYEA